MHLGRSGFPLTDFRFFRKSTIIQPYRITESGNFMKQFILQLGKDSKVCSNIVEAKDFISQMGHLTSAGEKRLASLFNGSLCLSRDFAWMLSKHIPELKNYPEQSCRMWIKPYLANI